MIATVFAPIATDIRMAYNQIPVIVFTSGVNPVVYLDIYMGTFYKTIQATSPDSQASGFDVWNFDIKDAVQEFLRATVPALAHSTSVMNNSAITYCRVSARGSTITGGYIVPDGPAPIQATMDNPPTPGGGVTMAGNPTFLAVNGALQQDEGASARAFLDINLVQPGRLDPIYNLFRNPYMEVSKNDYLSLPVLFDKLAVNGATTGQLAVSITANVRGMGQMGFYLGTRMAYFSDSVYYLPAGPKNFEPLAPVFPTIPGVPNVPPWDLITSYRIELQTDFAVNPSRWVSPWINMVKPCDDVKRFRFVNWFGHYDNIRFDQHQEEFRTGSSTWQKANVQLFDTTGREAVARQRFNVRSSEILTVVGYFQESEMLFVKQFLASPTAYQEQKGKYGGTDFLKPVVVQDATALTRKIDERYVYEVTVQLAMSNERINIRN